MRDFRRYAVFERAHQVVLDVYAAVQRFPQSETYGLTSQLRRAAASIPTNFVEGAGRSTDAEFARFLEIAIGSASEVEYELLLARDLGYLSPDTHDKLVRDVIEVRRMLYALSQRLRQTVG